MASSSSPAPQNKRKRTEDDSEVTKDEEVWLSDGNIVVVSRNTAFRVHKSILARHSEVFRDLFTLPEAGVDEYMDGCPVVHLNSDDPDDLRHLFLVVCCGKNYYYGKDDMLPVPFNVLASLIRTSHKYAITTVLDDALGRLKKYFPMEMDAWLDKAARSRYVLASGPLDPLIAVRLARLTDAHSILPTAYLACAESLSNVRMLSNSLIPFLEPRDSAKILKGATSLIRFATHRFLNIATTSPVDACATSEECALAAYRRLATIYGDSFYKVNVKYAFEPMEGWFLESSSGGCGLCERCTAEVKESDLRSRADTWKKLSSIFSLRVDGWPSSQ